MILDKLVLRSAPHVLRLSRYGLAFDHRVSLGFSANLMHVCRLCAKLQTLRHTLRDFAQLISYITAPALIERQGLAPPSPCSIVVIPQTASCNDESSVLPHKRN